MNPALLARELASALGSLDPKPEPSVVFQGPTRLIRIVDERGELWIDPRTGREVEVDAGFEAAHKIADGQRVETVSTDPRLAATPLEPSSAFARPSISQNYLGVAQSG